MRCVVLRVLVVGVVLMALVPGMADVLIMRVNAQQQDACVSAIPANIQAGLLAADIIALLDVSPTFRAQCERIAAAPFAHVFIELVQSALIARADTTITRYEAGALRADVRIHFGQNYRELIAHEFEHIIEQLDGVDLQAEVQQGRAWVIDAHAFETRRATDVGRRVRRECELPAARTGIVIH